MGRRRHGWNLFKSLDDLDKLAARRERKEKKEWTRQARQARLEERQQRARDRREDARWRAQEKEREALAQKRAKEEAKAEIRWRLLTVQQRFEDLTATEFEECIALIFEKMGYQTEICGGAGDEGIDVKARREGEYVLIQCKKYAPYRKVGSHDVQHFYSAVLTKKATQGYFVTTSDFTKNAKDYAHRKRIELVDGVWLNQWGKTYKIGPYAEEYPKPEPPSQSPPVSEPENIIYGYPPGYTEPEPIKPSPEPLNFSAPPLVEAVPLPPTPRPEPPRPVAFSPAKRGFSLWQWLVLLILSGTALVVACGVCAAVGSTLQPPAAAGLAAASAAPGSQSKEGLTFAVGGAAPGTASIQPQAGQFWQVNVAIHNPTTQPLKITTYEIFLRDRQGREVWYHHDLTYLAIKNNPVVADIQPGQTLQVAMVYDVPADWVEEASINYNGAEVWFPLAKGIN